MSSDLYLDRCGGSIIETGDGKSLNMRNATKELIGEIIHIPTTNHSAYR